MRLFNGVRLIETGYPCLPNVERLDAGAMPLIQKMASRGLRVDLDHFAKLDTVLTDDMNRLIEEVRSMTGYYVNLGSGDQVAELLFKKLGLKQARAKLTSSGDRESVEDEVLTAIQHDHPVVPKCLEYKEYEKLRGTYVRPMPKLARRVAFGVWRMFPNFKTTRVPSGRLSCADPNLLAMPTRTEMGKEIRKGFITDPGWVFVSIDESQIEVRIAAHRSKDINLLRVYQNKEDIYSDFAIAAFRLVDKRFQDPTTFKWKYPTVDDLDHRRPAKTCVLASIYDVTAGGLLEQMPVVCRNCNKPARCLKCIARKKHNRPEECTEHNCSRFSPLWTEDKCQDLINAFYKKYPGLLRMRKIDHAWMRKNAYICDMWGRMQHIAAVRSVHEWVVSKSLREGANLPMQCLSGDSIVISKEEGALQIRDVPIGPATLWDGREWSSGIVAKTGYKQQLKITLSNGLHLKCSPDHPLLIAGTSGSLSWIAAANLKVGCNTRVVLSDTLGEWNWVSSSDLEMGKIPSRKPVSLLWGIDDPTGLGEFLGRIASDGSVCRSSRDGAPKVTYLLCAEKEFDILPRLQELAGRTCEFRVSDATKKGARSALKRLEIYSQKLADKLLSWDIKHRVPPIAWKNSDILRGYLRGVFDGDGTVSPDNGRAGSAVYLTFGLHDGKQKLAEEIQLALLHLGIRSRLRIYSTRLHLSIQKSDFWKFYSRVGFMSGHKKSRMAACAFDGTRPVAAYGNAVRVSKVEKLDPVDMFDFVNSSTGRFSANGMIVHNSGAQGTIKLTMGMVNEDLENGLEELIHPLLQVHDELVFECREDVADEWGELVTHRFETCVKLDVDIKTGVAKAENWGSLPK